MTIPDILKNILPVLVRVFFQNSKHKVSLAPPPLQVHYSRQFLQLKKDALNMVLGTGIALAIRSQPRCGKGLEALGSV